MQSKIKYIAIALFVIDAILIVVNTKYRDPVASAIPDLSNAKIFYFLAILGLMMYGGLWLIVCFKKINLKEVLKLIHLGIITALTISVFFNLRLAKTNYDRITCNNGIAAYYEYFERDCGSKIEKRFEADVKNKEIKYFQDEYNPNWEFEKRLRDQHGIELISSSCTMFTSMHCYNDLVIEYIKKKDSLR
ncbi:hypothetical protein ACFO3O_01150 [Dokdonia ponticola]|uniref:Uncharacterized protein n=1 Tax=Dokdonia ponticola TaxID=2041041 RepID=A0ABV9HS93_9FLAO